MENKLEQLLNSLIKRGRVSFRDYDIAEFNQIGNTFVAINYEGKVIGQFSFRQIVSKESGLWQFVCKNGMIKNQNIDQYWKNYFELDHIEYYQSDFQYWVLESSLKDDSELEDFLLSNIKADD